MGEKVVQWQEEIKIDRYNLEIECEKQAALFTKYALQHVDLLHELDTFKLVIDELRKETKLTKDVAYADCELEIRKKADRDRVKLTVDNVKALIITDQEYLDICGKADAELSLKEDEYLDLKHKVDQAAAIREGFKQRKDMLGHEVFLWGASYYADPPTEDKTVREINKSLSKKKGVKK